MSVLTLFFIALWITVVVAGCGILLLARLLLGKDHADTDRRDESAAPGRLEAIHVWNHFRVWFKERPRRLTSSRQH